MDVSSELFYTPVLVGGEVTLRGLLDSGSMSCTLSEEAERKLRAAGALPSAQLIPGNVVLVGCGGKTAYPKCFYDLEIEVYESKFVVPTLVVPGQRDDFIVGTNVIKSVLQIMRKRKEYWELISSKSSDPDCERFLELLSCVSRWEAPGQCDKVGTVKLVRSVTLLPQREHLVWGRLPGDVPVSPGSTVVVEPTSARSTPQNILVGRLATAMWGDRWVPMRILNPTLKPITLRRNAKIADVFPCLAIEDLNITQGSCRTQAAGPSLELSASALSGLTRVMNDAGLSDIDLDSCEVSQADKAKLASLLLEYSDIFSKDSLDCGEAKDFVHRIHLTDDRPFRLPYRRIPPAHYQKLRQVLNEMEEREIIRKSIILESQWTRRRLMLFRPLRKLI
nr:uncharacterized protein LOC111848834 [Paramormyrops kingsleyae]